MPYCRGFLFRDAVLQQTLDKISNEMTVDYNSTFTVKSFFDGLSGLNYEIHASSKNADTLLK
jgi:arginine utilization protein RocB